MAVSGSRSGRMAELHKVRSQLGDRETDSPDRTKIRPDQTGLERKLPSRGVPVVYYISKKGQLEHPHFMEVPLSSSQGLLLRDVISRLNVLRGKGMAAIYSWSCKRSYKNGFVWHDLQENDLICPAHGDEYVLKGSELPASEIPDTKPRPEPAAAVRLRRNQSCSSIDSPNLQEYGVFKDHRNADVSTQTHDARRRRDEIELSVSPPPSDSSSSETFQRLVKSETDQRPAAAGDPSTAISKLVDQEAVKPSSSMLMQLISCGSISQYKMRVPRRRPNESPSLRRSTS